MKQITLIGILFITLLVLMSCELGSKSYAEEVFEKVKLNSNKIPDGFKLHFKEIQAQLKAGSLVLVTPENEIKKVNATEYVKGRYVALFDRDIDAIKSIEPNEETLVILKAALDLFYYADTIYKFDFPHIARMIDEGRAQEDIERAITNLEENKSQILNEKYNKVHDLIMPYADKHGVKYEIITMPKPIRYK
ncbi:hypothetical protein HX004_06375 [Myroides sp. 1354]|uniref:hypothetical protein n=1 Tax=unclassified Myroides TaxID=2642485 RepID=UPI002578E9D2|nr:MULTISPECIES: hypothetical protein [unclassified Myroides]MDM1044687.1 hypothetical protein [Myroides sp. R163-1]MDM1055400.1 hypothetical protein [Myroides sp. 1354]MDM1068697.1 hypothetical protein [Myroides sp. 1372]